MTEQYKLQLRPYSIKKGDKFIYIRHNGKWKYGFFFIHNCKFVKPKYVWTGVNFNEGNPCVKRNGKLGYVDINGNETWNN